MRRSEQEVFELGPIEDEEDHREGDADDLDEEEDHDSLRSQPAHVVEQCSFDDQLREEDSHVYVVAIAILPELLVHVALDNHQVDDRL